jgi:hypothetical protein
MITAIPQRTVNICLSGRNDDDTSIAYSFWSPNDGLTRLRAPVCDMIEKVATNTLFILDYASTLNGWTIVGIEPRPPSPAIQYVMGPENTSVLTIDPCVKAGIFAFYISYLNTITNAQLKFDPQEGNEPHK